MKYIINESQIKNLMWKYFDTPNYKVKRSDNQLYLINDDGSFDWCYLFNVNRLLVSNEIIFGFSSMFNVSGEEALDYAGEWFEEKYDYPIGEIVNWDFTGY